MNNLFLSIIIPLYNPKLQDFRRCIMSIKEINIPHEIIIIDDGSTDNISYFCEKFIENSSNVKYIKKNNGGVSSARNLGIKNSKGEYILFLDSDDELSLDFIKYLNNNYKKICSDWVIFGILVKELRTGKNLYRSIIDNRRFNGHSDIFFLSNEELLTIRVGSNELNESCGKLVRRNLLKGNHIFFPEGVISGEDKRFNTDLMFVVKTVQCIPIYGYIYYYSSNLGKRLIGNLEQRYKYFFSTEDRLSELVLSKSKSENQRDLEKLQFNMLITTIGQDVLILDKSKQLTKYTKKILTSYINNNKACTKFSFFDCISLKAKFFYLLIKKRMWLLVKFANFLKSDFKK